MCTGPAFFYSGLRWSPDKLLWFSRLPNCDLSEMKDTSSSVFLLPLLGVLVLQKSSVILLCASLEVEPGPCQKAALLFLDCSSLVFACPPFPE